MSDVDIIVYSFAKMAKSNTLISAYKLSEQDQESFGLQIIEAQRCFVTIIDGARTPQTSMNHTPRIQ